MPARVVAAGSIRQASASRRWLTTRLARGLEENEPKPVTFARDGSGSLLAEGDCLRVAASWTCALWENGLRATLPRGGSGLLPRPVQSVAFRAPCQLRPAGPGVRAWGLRRLM